MSQSFPCPNRNCTYVFDMGLLPPAALVTCPLCALRFTYQATGGVPILGPAPPQPAVAPSFTYDPYAAPAPTAGVPPAPTNPWGVPAQPAGYMPPTNYAPTAPQTMPTDPYAAFAPAPTAVAEPPPPPTPKEPAVIKRPVKVSGGNMLLPIGLFLMSIGIAIVLFVKFGSKERNLVTRAGSEKNTDPNVSRLETVSDRNFSWESPPANGPWQDAAKTLKKTFPDPIGPLISVALERKDGSAAMFLAVVRRKDDRDARPIELRNEREAILNYFKNLEYKAGSPVKWAGKDATLFEFQGRIPQPGTKEDEEGSAGVDVRGELVMLTYKGIAYYFCAWSRVDKFAEVSADFGKMRERFNLLKLRENWQPKKTNIYTYAAVDADYVVEDIDNIWMPVRPKEEVKHRVDATTATTTFDIRQEPFLYDGVTIPLKAYAVKYPNLRDRPKDGDALAVVVEVFQKDGDPLDVFRKHIEGIIRKEAEDAGVPTELKEVSDPPFEPIPDGAPILRLDRRSADDKSGGRRIVLSAIRTRVKMCEGKVVGDRDVGGKKVEETDIVVGVYAECKLSPVGLRLLEPTMIALAASLKERLD